MTDTGSLPAGAGRRLGLLSAQSALGFVVLLGVMSLSADVTCEGGRSLVGQCLCLLGASAAAGGIQVLAPPLFTRANAEHRNEAQERKNA